MAGEGELGAKAIDVDVAFAATAAAILGEAATLAGTPPGAALEELPIPTAIARHLIIRRLGAGAMGVVYAAYDPELDRRLAIKVLRAPTGAGEDPATARLRVLREAQAMARVTHPGVVQVFDVGTHEGQIYIAMELVEGETLAAWLTRGRRSWRQVLAVFVQAGRGLAAAHAAGVIHRDFKPDNVLIDRDGRARVADFGLARAGEVAAMPTAEDAAETASGASLGSFGASLTRGGALVGTPAYLAPELWAGAPADARSDLFAFAVALFEALHGARPFQAEDLRGLAAAIAGGAITWPERGPRVPAWIDRELRRALAPRPEERHPSIAALVKIPSERPGRRRRGLVGAALVGGLGVAFSLGIRGGTSQLCEGAEANLDGIWDAPRREALHARFAASSEVYAESSWRGLEAALDTYTAAWVTMRRDACEAAQIRGDESTALMDRRIGCLDHRLDLLRELLDAATSSPAPLVDAAPAIMGGLRSLDRCANAEALLAELPPPEEPAVAAEVARIRSSLVKVEALGLALDYRAATSLGDAAIADAEATGYRPVLAEALFQRAHLDRLRGDRDLDRARAAYAEAEAAGHERIRFRAATDLIYLAANAKRFDEADAWSAVASAQVPRLRLEDREVAELERSRGALAFFREDWGDAVTHTQRALELNRRALPPGTPEIGRTLGNLGIALVWSGDPVAAEAVLLEAEAIARASLGGGHPFVANALWNLSEALSSQGRHLEARDTFRRQLAIRTAIEHEAAMSARHRCLVAIFSERAGDREGALAEHRDCLQAIANVPPHDRAPLAARAHAGLCEGLADEPAAAVERRASCQEAAAAVDALAEDKSFGPVRRLEVLVASAEASWAAGEATRAIDELGRAIALINAVEGADATRRAPLLVRRGAWLIASDRRSEAEIALAEAAWRLEGPDAPAGDEGEALRDEITHLRDGRRR